MIRRWLKGGQAGRGDEGGSGYMKLGMAIVGMHVTGLTVDVDVCSPFAYTENVGASRWEIPVLS